MKNVVIIKLISHNIPAFLPPSVLLRRKEEPDAINTAALLGYSYYFIQRNEDFVFCLKQEMTAT